MNITEFLEARIAEDEALARAALSGMYGEHHDAWDYAGYVLGADRDSTPKQDEFITVWWPKRVLAECAAKRDLIEGWEDPNGAGVWEGYDAGSAIATDRAARALAAIYKDHPDYQQEWLSK